ncbi:MAG TPA: methionine--tRNA ligase subunit beta, partial [Ignavibacteria bacterium]|nr:methionine--tRNA ligase subunit beta [Ignavibacteria bacterium]
SKACSIKVGELFDRYKIKDGVFESMQLARDANKYFNDSEPWITVKNDKDKCGTTLYVCLQLIYTLSEIFYPVIPNSSEKIFKMLNTESTEWDKCGDENLSAGHTLNKAEILFKKIEDNVIEKQIESLGKTKSDVTNEDGLVTIDEFFKVELKVAKILDAEKVEKSQKLMKLKVETDDGERQVIAGIAKDYNPESILNKKILIVANLKPVKLMGHISEGMLLAAENEDGKLKIIEIDDSVKIGTRVK